MWYLLNALWLPLVLAVLLGLAAGWWIGRSAEGRSGAWVAWPLAILAVGGIGAWWQLLPGRAGLWLDAGLLLLAAYAAGSLAGGLAGRARGGAAGSRAAPQG
jgi:hypothetical protein